MVEISLSLSVTHLASGVYRRKKSAGGDVVERGGRVADLDVDLVAGVGDRTASRKEDQRYLQVAGVQLVVMWSNVVVV